MKGKGKRWKSDGTRIDVIPVRLMMAGLCTFLWLENVYAVSVLVGYLARSML